MVSKIVYFQRGSRDERQQTQVCRDFSKGEDLGDGTNFQPIGKGVGRITRWGLRYLNQ